MKQRRRRREAAQTTLSEGPSLVGTTRVLQSTPPPDPAADGGGTQSCSAHHPRGARVSGHGENPGVCLQAPVLPGNTQKAQPEAVLHLLPKVNGVKGGEGRA